MSDYTLDEARRLLRHYQFQRNSGAPTLNEGAHGQTSEQQIMTQLLSLAEFYAKEYDRLTAYTDPELEQILRDFDSSYILAPVADTIRAAVARERGGDR